MLEIRDLTFRYGKKQPPVLDRVSLNLSSGEFGVLLGKNGSGKSTLFANVLGLLKPESGKIFLDGTDLQRLSVRERAKLISYVPQDFHFGGLSVREVVLTGRLSRFGLFPGAEDLKAVGRTLEETGLSALADRNAETLSGGEKQKLAIARALVNEPKLLLFDEPTENLDLKNARVFLETVRERVKSRGATVFAILHDLNRALQFGDRFFFLKDGRVVSEGNAELFTPDRIRDVFDSEVEIAEIHGKKVVVDR